MKPNQEAKAKVVEEIKEKIKKSKSLIFINYRGIKVGMDTALRREFRNAACEYRVYKNKLVARAFKELGIEGFDDDLQETLAIGFGYSDEVTPARLLANVIDKESKLEFKFGLLGTEKMDASRVKEISKLPSREVLIAKLLSVLNGPLTKFVMTLDAIAKK